MARYFSPSKNGFYDEAIHGPRMLSLPQSDDEIKIGKRAKKVPNPDCMIPADAVEINDSYYQGLMIEIGKGRSIVARNGKPVAIDPALDVDQYLASRRLRRDRALAASDWTQLPDSPLSSDMQAAWASYRQQLRDLDLAGADWPETPKGE